MRADGDDLIIRPSSLADWLDCPRRFAARHLRDMLASAGYDVNERRPGHIGAHVGTGLHAAAAHVLKARLATGTDAAQADANAIAIAEMRERMQAEGCQWDDVTHDLNTAEKQLLRMMGAWRQHIAPQIRPQLIEERLECMVAPGIIMSGQVDVADTIGNGVKIRDNKTTKQARSAHAQLGAYGVLLASHSYDVQGAAIDHIVRTSLKNEQPKPETREVAFRPAVDDAIEAIEQIGATVEKFQQRAADPNGRSPIAAFTANPGSALCSARWCPAFGTNTCRAHVE